MTIKILVIWDGHGDQVEIDLTDYYLFSEISEIKKSINIDSESPAQLFKRLIINYLNKF